MNATDIEKM